MNKINISDLLEYLNYSDLRAVRKWCEKNKVFIIRQGKCEFVMETNFKEAYEKPFINKLKKQFGNDWESVYRLYTDGNVPALFVLNDVTSTPVSIFKAKSNSNNKFTKKLEDYERKKKNAA